MVLINSTKNVVENGGQFQDKDCNGVTTEDDDGMILRCRTSDMVDDMTQKSTTVRKDTYSHYPQSQELRF